jgi:hypothetical protein
MAKTRLIRLERRYCAPMFVAPSSVHIESRKRRLGGPELTPIPPKKVNSGKADWEERPPD